MIDFDNIFKHAITSKDAKERENVCVVRLKTSTWSDKRGVYLKKSITYLRRLSKGYLILEEDTKNIGTEVIEDIINLDECSDGVYEVATCNEQYDWETGYIDSYDYKLVRIGD